MAVLIGTDQVPAVTAASSTNFGHSAWSAAYVASASGQATDVKVNFSSAQAGSYALAIYDVDLNLVGETAVSTESGAGIQTLSIVTPFTVAVDEVYYFGWRSSASRDIVGDDGALTTRRNDSAIAWDAAFPDPRLTTGSTSSRRLPMIWVEGASTAPALTLPEVFDPTLDGFSFRFTTDTGNGTAIWAVYATSAARDASTVASIQAEIATPNISLARGQFTVTTAGVQTVAGITGLGAAQARYVRVFQDGIVA